MCSAEASTLMLLYPGLFAKPVGRQAKGKGRIEASPPFFNHISFGDSLDYPIRLVEFDRISGESVPGKAGAYCDR
jgi:hypothetical protein